jgi:hypothetical protein
VTSTVIFSGPSLPPSCIAGAGVAWRPPLRQGDFRRAVDEGATVLGVVDGVFETTPTVWHEEILFALDRGATVYGASSIGALRAVELCRYGMVGVGRIFQWYLSGELEADDEVALLHGPAEVDYVALTEPMVNVRATMAQALDLGILPASTADRIIASAKTLFYKDRTWETVLQPGSVSGLSVQECDQARHAVGLARTDQKRIDAETLLALLNRVAEVRPG